MEKPSGHAFISYVREDSDRVDELQRNLEAAGISVWRDTADLWPGEDWRLKIRRAITDNALVFLACFSSRSAARATSYQNEELLLAIDQLRRRRPDDPWFIPVRFDDCPVPDYDLGGGRILASIQRVDLYGQQRDAGITRLVITIQRRLEQHLPAQETAQSRSITPNPPPWTAATRSAPSPSRTHPSASPTSGHRTIAAPPHHYARILTSHQAAVVGVAFSPDGTLLATSGYDRAARLWDPATGRFISGFTCHMGPVGAVAFSPDGTLLATSGGETARLWKVATGQLTRTLTGHQKVVVGVAFSPDGTLLATASHDAEARLWDLATQRFWDVATGRGIRTLTGHRAAVVGVAFSPDGTLLATASHDETARLWDVATERCIRTLTGHRAAVVGVAFSPDGTLLATASYDAKARLWDVATGRCIRTLAGHRDATRGVAFSPDSALLATTSGDRRAGVWDVATGRCIRTLTGHREAVVGVAFSPDGTLLATASDDETARLWSL